MDALYDIFTTPDDKLQIKKDIAEIDQQIQEIRMGMGGQQNQQNQLQQDFQGWEPSFPGEISPYVAAPGQPQAAQGGNGFIGPPVPQVTGPGIVTRRTEDVGGGDQYLPSARSEDPSAQEPAGGTPQVSWTQRVARGLVGGQPGPQPTVEIGGEEHEVPRSDDIDVLAAWVVEHMGTESPEAQRRMLEQLLARQSGAP